MKTASHNIFSLGIKLTALIGIILAILIVRDNYWGWRSGTQKFFPFNVIIKQRDWVSQGAADFHINHTQPSFADIAASVEKNTAMSDSSIQDYIIYYYSVLERFPDSDQANSMLGYLYFWRGDLKEAERYYKKAVKLAPAVFWHHYNLGIIYFSEGRVEEATASFNGALQANGQLTVEQASKSVIYAQIARAMDNKSYNLVQSVEGGHKSAGRFLSYLKRNTPIAEIKPLLKPQLF
ncbi:MAG: tetratricopeptide repeat protein [Candidatus Omnitrophica bacterium]|nr:tetratricopeptide repeat protein [Candidatus Omnitrophota bacterium]